MVTAFPQGVGKGPATVSLKARAQNLEKSAVTFTATGTIAPASRVASRRPSLQDFTLQPSTTLDIAISATVSNPAIWWPRQWGAQPLYAANLTVSVAGGVSDAAAKKFGFRTVTAKVVNDDIGFTINGQPFQVVGGGYGPDMFLRWTEEHFRHQLQYLQDLGFNTIRLEERWSTRRCTISPTKPAS